MTIQTSLGVFTIYSQFSEFSWVINDGSMTIFVKTFLPDGFVEDIELDLPAGYTFYLVIARANAAYSPYAGMNILTPLPLTYLAWVIGAPKFDKPACLGVSPRYLESLGANI